MISYITGLVQKINIGTESFVDILTNSGLGYRVYIPSNVNIVKGDTVSLYTHFHVREDNQILFGFSSEEERDFFEILISVSGVGPKTGLTILSTYEKKELEQIIFRGDAKTLCKVKGLGMKGAQKIILELRGKVDLDENNYSDKSQIKELKEALRSLGFSGEILKSKIDIAEKILEENSDIDIEDLIKEVLVK